MYKMPVILSYKGCVKLEIIATMSLQSSRDNAKNKKINDNLWSMSFQMEAFVEHNERVFH